MFKVCLLLDRSFSTEDSVGKSVFIYRVNVTGFFELFSRTESGGRVKFGQMKLEGGIYTNSKNGRGSLHGSVLAGLQKLSFRCRPEK